MKKLVAFIVILIGIVSSIAMLSSATVMKSGDTSSTRFSSMVPSVSSAIAKGKMLECSDYSTSNIAIISTRGHTDFTFYTKMMYNESCGTTMYVTTRIIYPISTHYILVANFHNTLKTHYRTVRTSSVVDGTTIVEITVYGTPVLYIVDEYEHDEPYTDPAIYVIKFIVLIIGIAFVCALIKFRE